MEMASDASTTVASLPPVTTPETKRTIGWQSLLARPEDAVPTPVHMPASTQPHSRPGSSSTAPSDAIFNTQFTTAGRKFLSKVKKNRAMQVDRRTKGFQLGLEHKTVMLDPTTKKHYRILIVDPDLQHREDLADALEHYVEIFVAATNERAFALLAMFKVDLVLLRMTLGNDHSTATSPGLQFLKEAKRRYVHLPVSLLVKSAEEQHKLVAHALALGACGFFQDDLDVDTLLPRLGKLLHSLVLASIELVKCRGKPLSTKDVDASERSKHTATALLKRGTTTVLARRPATSKPATLVYDKDKMLLELSLKQRKQCLARRQQLSKTLATSHSVLGIGQVEEEPVTDALGSPMLHCDSPSLLDGCSLPTPSQRSGSVNNLRKTIAPLPSASEISRRIYAKPHELQSQIHRHLYDAYHSHTMDAVPCDPLLRPCVAIDPASVSKSAGNLLVGKAHRLYLERRYDEAMAQCDRAIQRQDNNVVKLAYLLRGVLCDLSGDAARAEREFQTCLTLDPNMHQAHFNLSVCRLKMGRDNEALQDVTTALHLAPATPDYVANRALIYRRLGEFGLAQAEYAKLKHPESGGTSSSIEATDVDDGLFDHLFGKPTPDKLALLCAPPDRDAAMVERIVARLQSVLFFQEFPRDVLRDVARQLEYDVVACGKRFTLGEDHPHSFYVLLSGRLSVRRKLGDFASAVTTHHLESGTPFGSTGHVVSSHTQLIADESSEVGILWPDAFDSTLRAYCTAQNNDVFAFLQQLKAFALFSASELGHVIGISERRRFRKGETLLGQNDVPKHLVILRKGTCLMYQHFDRPPLCDSDDSRDEGSKREERGGSSLLPFHHAMAKPDWPLGFRVHHNQSRKKKLKHERGMRRNALPDRLAAPRHADLLLHAAHHSREQVDEEAKPPRGGLNSDVPVRTLGPGAIFGESALLEQKRVHAKCSVVADSVVEVLLFDHLRLQEMELAPDIVEEILRYAPEYIDQEQAIKQQAKAAAWDEYKSHRLLELSKTRWPDAKRHLRVLSNGCSILLDTTRHTVRPSTSSGHSTSTALD